MISGQFSYTVDDDDCRCCRDGFQRAMRVMILTSMATTGIENRVNVLAKAPEETSNSMYAAKSWICRSKDPLVMQDEFSCTKQLSWVAKSLAVSVRSPVVVQFLQETSTTPCSIWKRERSRSWWLSEKLTDEAVGVLEGRVTEASGAEVVAFASAGDTCL